MQLMSHEENSSLPESHLETQIIRSDSISIYYLSHFIAKYKIESHKTPGLELTRELSLSHPVLTPKLLGEYCTY